MKGSQHKDPDPAMLATDRRGRIGFYFLFLLPFGKGRERKGKENKEKEKEK